MSKDNNKKAPKIRFPGFTDDWEQRKLWDETTEMLAGGDIDKSRVVENGQYPIYANALTNDGIVGYYDDYYRVKAPAVTVTGRGDVGHAQARTVDFTPVVRLLAIRSEHDVYFLENAINKHGVIVESTGVPQLTVPQLGNYIISFPTTINEEIKIGNYFHNLDHLITLHQRKLEKLKEYKKGVLQKMFPKSGEKVPEVRFPGFDGEWEERKYEDFCSIITKQTGFDYTATIKKSLVQEASSDTLPYLQTKNFAGTTIEYNTDYYIPKSVAKKFPKINLNEKCVLFSIVGASVGNIGLFPGDKHCFLSGAICVSKFIDETDADYLYHFMCSYEGQSQIRNCTKGGAQATVTIEDIRGFKVKTPSKDERNKIGEYFNSLDRLIALQQKKIEFLKEFKKGCLQQMFV